MRDPHAGSNPRASTLAVTVVAALALTACAGGPTGGPGGRGPGGPAPALFISPFGEPFVAGVDDPWPVADWFLGADADLDGGVTFEEFTADGARWFGRLDADRDGRLNQTELAAYEISLRGFGSRPGPPVSGAPGREGPRGGGGRRPGGGMAENLAPDAPQQGPGAGGPPSGGPPRGAPQGGGSRRPQGYGTIAEAGFFNLPQPVKAADINVDQRVTAAEWSAATQRWFLALDTDRDGRLTLATLPKPPLQQRAEARRR